MLRMGAPPKPPTPVAPPLLQAGPPICISRSPKPLAAFNPLRGAALGAGGRKPAPAPALLPCPATDGGAVELAAVELGLVTGVLQADRKSLSMKPRPWAELDDAAEGTARIPVGTASSQLAAATAPLVLAELDVAFCACRRSSTLSSMARRNTIYFRNVGAVMDDVVSNGVNSGTSDRAAYAALLLPLTASQNCTASVRQGHGATTCRIHLACKHIPSNHSGKDISEHVE